MRVFPFTLVAVLSVILFGPGCSAATRRPALEPATEPAVEPAVEPASDPASEPASDPAAAPAAATSMAPAPATSRRVTARRLPPEAKAILKVHNAARRAVGVAPLRWSPRIAKYAQVWANRLARLRGLQHRPHAGRWKQKYGENLAMAGGSAAISNYGHKGSVQWLGEKRRYKHGSRSLAGVGHYTQMVWRKSLHIGCAVARYTKGLWKMVILVCNYDPPGNMMGESPY